MHKQALSMCLPHALEEVPWVSMRCKDAERGRKGEAGKGTRFFLTQMPWEQKTRGVEN